MRKEEKSGRVNYRDRRNVGVEMCENDRRNDAKMSGCENLFG